MSEPERPPQDPILTLDEIRTDPGDRLVGYRLTTHPGGETVLVFADQSALPGFRLGRDFVAGLGHALITAKTIAAPEQPETFDRTPT